MSILYKEQNDIKYSVELEKLKDESIRLSFSCDGGKFHTDEMLDEFKMPVKQLLDILQRELRSENISKLLEQNKDNL